MSRPIDRSEEDAFDRLFIQEYRRVVDIANRITGDLDEAEDVAQEAFASFHKQHDPSAAFASAWLHRASVHLALNLVRSRKRRLRRQEESGRRAERVQPLGLSENPAAGVERAEARHAVRETLARMPKRSAQVLALRHSGLSYAEVAAAMRCRVGDVGTMLRRAESTFRKEFEQ